MAKATFLQWVSSWSCVLAVVAADLVLHTDTVASRSSRSTLSFTARVLACSILNRSYYHPPPGNKKYTSQAGKKD